MHWLNHRGGGAGTCRSFVTGASFGHSGTPMVCGGPVAHAATLSVSSNITLDVIQFLIRIGSCLLGYDEFLRRLLVYFGFEFLSGFVVSSQLLIDPLLDCRVNDVQMVEPDTEAYACNSKQLQGPGWELSKPEKAD